MLDTSDIAWKNDLGELQSLVKRLARQQAEDRQTMANLTAKVKVQEGQISALQAIAGIRKGKRPAGDFTDLSTNRFERLAHREMQRDALPALRREVLSMTREVFEKIEVAVKLDITEVVNRQFAARLRNQLRDEITAKNAKTQVAVVENCRRVIAEMSDEALLGSEEARRIRSDRLRLAVNREIDRLWLAERTVRVRINNAEADAEETMSDLYDASAYASAIKDDPKDTARPIFDLTPNLMMRYEHEKQDGNHGIPNFNGMMSAHNVDGDKGSPLGTTPVDINDEDCPDTSIKCEDAPPGSMLQADLGPETIEGVLAFTRVGIDEGSRRADHLGRALSGGSQDKGAYRSQTRW